MTMMVVVVMTMMMTTMMIITIIINKIPKSLHSKALIVPLYFVIINP